MAGASHYDGIKKQVSKNDQLEEDKKTVKVHKLMMNLSAQKNFFFFTLDMLYLCRTLGRSDYELRWANSQP